ncbi:MAG: hypothetical protein JXK93_08570 [Sphaerochaetaceae bacterium]|nr:hypothetical protein [Sphaerochaetaceae bacterium]
MAVIKRVIYKTLRDNRDKEHTCIGCGKTYTYRMTREGRFEDHNSTLSDLDPVFEKDCDLVPCPHCGLYQAEMVEKMRMGRGTGSSFVFTLWAGIFIIFLSFGKLSTLVGAAWLCMVLFSAYVYLRNANMNPNSGTERTARGMPVPGGEGPWTEKKKVLYVLLSLAALFAVVLFLLTVTGSGDAMLRVMVLIVSAVLLFLSGLKFMSAAGCGQFPRSWKH